VDEFERLVEAVQGCRRCPTMEGRRRVLGPANGRLDARVLFVAEAPGRLGGDRTGVPLSSDQTGRNFARLLGAAGLRRDEVFVTNAG
jgi:DNA polymerase